MEMTAHFSAKSCRDAAHSYNESLQRFFMRTYPVRSASGNVSIVSAEKSMKWYGQRAEPFPGAANDTEQKGLYAH